MYRRNQSLPPIPLDKLKPSTQQPLECPLFLGIGVLVVLRSIGSDLRGKLLPLEICGYFFGGGDHIIDGALTGYVPMLAVLSGTLLPPLPIFATLFWRPWVLVVSLLSIAFDGC